MTVPQRLHSIDAVRSFALLSGILLHAALSFLPGLRSVGFPIADQSESVALGLMFFLIHSFRMSLFFLIAGFFAHQQYHKQGARSFLVNRGKRIVLPLLLFWPILCPLVIIPIAYAAIQHSVSGTPSPPPAPDSPFFFPLMHLWFLYVLIILYVVTLALRGVVVRLFDREGVVFRSVDRTVREILIRPAGAAILAIPVAVAFLFEPDWILWMGIPTPDKSLIPNLTALIAFLLTFGFGWLLHRQPALLDSLKARWKMNLMLAAGMSVAALTINGPVPRFEPVESLGVKVPYAVCYATATWYWIFAVMGMGLRFFDQPIPTVRYLSDASYWLYLVHLPPIFLAQAIIMDWPLHWSVKFPLILLATVPLLLLSYHYCVRSTFVGAFLNGRRYTSADLPQRTTEPAIAVDPTDRLSSTQERDEAQTTR
ncbi:acyltransferase family protein [Schlesneria sp. T3-172]|uniref:acyltransferase family protein n=1 Tax=Schlesneria sphaerica TaxID=3373610 RepID=UPI0037C57762